MAGITDGPFRRICTSWGAGLTYSEMVSAKGLWYNDKKTADLMKITPEERPCAITDLRLGAGDHGSGSA